MMYEKLEPVIGLEIHVQLKTRSKLFSASDNQAEGAAPNTLINAIDVGHPGTLPHLNTQALHFAVRVGLALECQINTPTFFDRKHYIYPDLPKGYQISQFDVPVCGEGELVLEIPGTDEVSRIRIERAHLEEDAGKNVHRDGKTLVDYNRAGTPLVEIVTKPDFRSPTEAKLFLQELRRIMRYIGVSDADMEKGHLRCDANISMRPLNKDGSLAAEEYYPKTEIKNLNSFKHVERALEYEIKRQSDLWYSNSPQSTTTTRGWNQEKQKTVLQRTKEAAADYRYMREPDIPPIDLTAIVQHEQQQLSELPAARRQRFKDEYGFRAENVWMLTDDPALSDFIEAVMSELVEWLVALPDIDGTAQEIIQNHRSKLAKLATTWIGTKLLGSLAARSEDIRTAHVTPENMAELMAMVFEKKLNNTSASKVLEQMLETGSDPSQIVEQQGLTQLDDAGQLETIVQDVLARHPDQVEQYKAGKIALLQFFIGMVQKETGGTANPQQTRELLDQHLS